MKEGNLLNLIIRISQDRIWCCLLWFTFLGIGITQFRKNPFGQHLFWRYCWYADEDPLSHSNLVLLWKSLWLVHPRSRQRVATDFKGTKMYFMLSPYRWFINSTPPAYMHLNLSFLRSYKAWPGIRLLSQRIPSVKLLDRQQFRVNPLNLLSGAGVINDALCPWALKGKDSSNLTPAVPLKQLPDV